MNDLLEFAKQTHLPQEKRRGILREYVQTLILYYLQRNGYAKNLVFIGGTAIRFFYNLQRFSEDLDFNYLGTLNKNQVEEIMVFLKKELLKENITIEYSIRKSQETYFHWKVYIQFPNLHPEENLSIQMDIQNLGKESYPIENKIISFFGKRFIFNTTHIDMFLAEKTNAMLYRKKPRGRDFFDFMSLIHKGAQLNFKFLKKRKIDVKNSNEYKELLIKRVKTLDFPKLTKQLSPFLFQPEDEQIMTHFSDFIEDLLKDVKDQ